MKVTIYIDGKPEELNIDCDGDVYYGTINVGNIIKTEDGRWKAIDAMGKEWFYQRRKDALLNICFDCPDFWKRSLQLAWKRSHSKRRTKNENQRRYAPLSTLPIGP